MSKMKNFPEDHCDESLLREEKSNKFRPVNRGLRFFLILFSSLITATVAWNYLRPLVVKELEGQGVMLAQSGLFTVRSEEEGIIREWLVHPGEEVKVGQAVARLELPEREALLRDAEERVSFLEAELKRLQEVVKEGEAEHEQLEQEIFSKNYRIQFLRQALLSLEKDLQEKSDLYESGMVALEEKQEVEQRFAKAKKRIESSEEEISSLYAQLQRGEHVEELEAINEVLDVARAQKESIQKQNAIRAFVRTDTAGKVLELMRLSNTFVASGTPVLWLERLSEKNKAPLFYGFLSQEEAKKVKIGALARIRVSGSNQTQACTLVGRVVEVSKEPLSVEKVAERMQNETLSRNLTHGRNDLVQIVVASKLEAEGLTGYGWSSEEGALQDVATGNQGRVKVVVR